MASKEKNACVGGGVHAGTNGRDWASRFQLSLLGIMFWNAILAVHRYLEIL